MCTSSNRLLLLPFGVATRLPFWCFSGVPIKGDKIKSGRLTLAFSGAQMRAEVLRNRCVLGVPIKGDRTKSGCLTPAFSGAHKRGEVLHNPCGLGIPIKGDKIESRS